jgi:hypothetical protein
MKKHAMWNELGYKAGIFKQRPARLLQIFEERLKLEEQICYIVFCFIKYSIFV